MDAYRKLMKTARAHEITLGGLFVIFAGLDVQAPEWINEFVRTNTGTIIMLAFAISLFFYLRPLVAILGLIAVYELIRRARGDISLSSDEMINFLPKTSADCRDLNAYNQFSKTLEQEIVDKMAPLTGPSVGDVSYHPEVADDHDATPLNMTNADIFGI
jgi:hypothetical protein